MRTIRSHIAALTAVVAIVVALAAPARADDLAPIVQGANEQLAARGIGVEVGAVELFTLGPGRPDDRDLQNPFRRVPYDVRRHADGARITYLVRQSLGATSNGLANVQTEPAIDAALTTWAGDSCVARAPIVKRTDPGVDTDIFDELVGAGDSATPNFGNLFRADVVQAGFRRRAFFDRSGPGGGDYIIGITITFFFRTDVNHDGYSDTAWTETYYNDNFAWSIGGGLPMVDVESVALHENGHALGLGHFGAPPDAVMNPFYSGVNVTPLGTDHAGACAVWGGWPVR